MRGATLLLTALVFAGPLDAKDVRFDPFLGLGAFYTQNVLYVGEDGPSDSGFRLRVILPVTVETRRSTTIFTYQPTFNVFSSFDELNNIGHRVSLTNLSQVSRSGQFSAGAHYRLTQVQGDPESEEAIDAFLDPRTERRQGRAELGYRQRFSPLWSAFVGANASRLEFHQIADFEPVDPSNLLEDRTTLRGTLYAARNLSPRTQLGLQYTARRFDLERSGEENAQTLWLRLEHTISTDDSLLLQVGGYTRDRAELEDRDTGFSGRIVFTRTLNRRTAFRLFGRIEPTAGTSRPGTTISSTLGAGLRSIGLRNWSWRLNARYDREDPNDPLLVVRDTWGASFLVSRRLGRVFWLNTRLAYNHQSGQQVSSVARAIVELGWRPLEKRAGSR